MNRTTTATSSNPREPIAIVGIGCRFPGAADRLAFWRLLREGRDAVNDVPRDRWDAAALHDPEPGTPGKIVSRRGGFLDRVDGFDWRAFRISPREAKHMDPQHRLALEVAWEALEDAGMPLEEVAGSPTGVFLGLMWHDYLELQLRDPGRLTGYAATGNIFAFAPSRISYTFDLKGPSIAIDCACAASLASVHAACQSLWLNECTMALAGGVSLIVSPHSSMMLSHAGLLSPDGRCKTLDAAADGFARGEGAGVVVLKLRSSLAPSDRVYGFIRGSALSHNGHNEWIMAASAAGQQEALRDAYRIAGVDPAEVDYVELHGTGFPKGDLIEATSLGDVVGRASGRRQPCRVGSVKSNLGHLDSAAGIAGLIKVALSLYRGEIPPTLHLRDVNPGIQLDALGLAPQRALGPWPGKTGPAIAGVTAISMAGVNAHIVLEGPPQREPVSQDTGQSELFPLSARSRDALGALARALSDFIAREEARISLPDLAYTMGVRRTHHEHRAALVAGSKPDLRDKLDAFARGARNDVGAEMAAPANERTAELEALAARYVAGEALDWRNICKAGGLCVDLPAYPWQRQSLWLEGLRADAHADAPAQGSTPEMPAEPRELRRRIAQAPRAQRGALVEEHVRNQVVVVLGLNPDQAPSSQVGLFDAGLNSLAAVELINRLRTSLAHPLPATLVFDYPTIAGLAGYLARDVLGLEGSSADDEPRNDVRAALLERLELLSEEEAEEQLAQRIRELSR